MRRAPQRLSLAIGASANGGGGGPSAPDARRACGASAVKAVVNGLLDAQKIPNEKYDDPITSAQEVGWYAKPLVQQNPRFQHGLKQAEATQFAETYTKKMAGEHMFHGKSGKYLKF